LNKKEDGLFAPNYSQVKGEKMQLVKLALVFWSALVFISACSDSNQKTIAEVEQEQDEAAMVEKESTFQKQIEGKLETTEFDGKIAQTESGLYLKTNNGEFIIEGQDLSAMVGKKVKVIGVLEESESGKKIHIASVTPIE
jgi:predicted lipoprotein